MLRITSRSWLKYKIFFFEKSLRGVKTLRIYIYGIIIGVAYFLFYLLLYKPNENCSASVWICVNPKSIFVMRILRLYARNNIGNKFSGISIRLRFIDRHINVYMCNETNEIGLLLVAAILRLYTYPINAGGYWKLKLMLLETATAS